MVKRDGDGRAKATDDGRFGDLTAIRPDLTGAHRVAQVLDALAAISLRFDTRAMHESAKRRDQSAFVAQVARVLHEFVREAADGQHDPVLVALRRVERFVLWVQERDPANDVSAKGASDASRMCELVLANLQRALWGGAPPTIDLR